MGVPLKTSYSRSKFRFGGHRQDSLGKISMKVPLGDFAMITEEVDVVKPSVPFLLGLDFMDKYKMYVNNVDNVLSFPHLDVHIPLIRRRGHIYLVWDTSEQILFTKSELVKLHRNFSHPTSEKLHALLKKARPDETDSKTKAILQEIEQRCEPCQRIARAPIRFKVSLPDEIDLKFCDEVSMDLMFLDGKAVLHVIDTAMHFSAATFLDSHVQTYGQTSEGIWLAFLEIWCTTYLGYPNRMRTDLGSAFTSEKWRHYTNSCGIKLRLSGAQAHNSLGIGERYHEPLRRIYRKISIDFPNVSPQILLKIAVKAMNDTMGESGKVPSLLVFGTIPASL